MSKSVYFLLLILNTLVLKVPFLYKEFVVTASAITTYGVRSCTLKNGFRHTFRWVLIVADIKQANMGADFFQHFGLKVDLHRLL